jgi:hypothetical protein
MHLRRRVEDPESTGRQQPREKDTLNANNDRGRKLLVISDVTETSSQVAEI